MVDSRLPLRIKPIAGGFAIVFADGGERIHVYGSARRDVESDETQLDDALELAKEVARALMAAWGDELRSVA